MNPRVKASLALIFYFRILFPDSLSANSEFAYDAKNKTAVMMEPGGIRIWREGGQPQGHFQTISERAISPTVSIDGRYAAHGRISISSSCGGRDDGTQGPVFKSHSLLTAGKKIDRDCENSIFYGNFKNRRRKIRFDWKSGTRAPPALKNLPDLFPCQIRPSWPNAFIGKQLRERHFFSERRQAPRGHLQHARRQIGHLGCDKKHFSGPGNSKRRHQGFFPRQRRAAGDNCSRRSLGDGHGLGEPGFGADSRGGWVHFRHL